MRQPLIITAAIALVVALAAWWFFANFERRTDTVEMGFQGEARRNPLLALQRFLEASGDTVQSIESLSRLRTMPDTSSALLVPTQRYDLGPQRSEQLHEWVEHGGHLIVVARERIGDVQRASDPLLDRYGIELTVDEEPDDGIGQDAEFEDGAKGDAHGSDETPSVEVTVDTGTEPYRVAFSPHRRVLLNNDSVEPNWWVGQGYGAHLVELAVGDGHLTVLSDAAFLNNPMIGEFDHAAFALRLLHVRDGLRNIVLVYRDDMPNLVSVLWRWAWSVLVSGAILLVAWLWSASRRFGPIVADPPLSRRSLREHIQASGRFLWHHGHRDLLIDAARQAMHRRIQQRHPTWRAFAQDELARCVAEATSMPIAEVQWAMHAEVFETEAELTRYMNTLNTIGKRL
jgi:hypothetical protein